MSIYHLKDIISGNRQSIKSKDVKFVHVPHFQGLSVENMLEFAKPYTNVHQILPSQQGEIENLHRGCIANVIYTVAGDDFTDWIDRKMKERTQKLTEEKNLNIKMDPEIFKIFKNSTSISGKCTFVYLFNLYL